MAHGYKTLQLGGLLKPQQQNKTSLACVHEAQQIQLYHCTVTGDSWAMPFTSLEKDLPQHMFDLSPHDCNKPEA